MEYVIDTVQGNRYVINGKGQVLEYYGNGLNKRGASEQELNTLRLTGGWYHKGFGHIGRIPLVILLNLDRTKLRYKNRKPIYGLADIDHGTNRLSMGDGIVGIYKREVN